MLLKIPAANNNLQLANRSACNYLLVPGFTGSGVYFYFNNASSTKNKKSFSHSQTKTIEPAAGKNPGAYLSGITDRTDQQLRSTVQEKAATPISSHIEQQKNLQNLPSEKNTVVEEQPLNASDITKLMSGTNMVFIRREK
jgi:hypothetical protein